MGPINSRLRRDGGRNLDDAPVMGNGYCPVYDAASVGDWERLIGLCEGAAVAKGEGALPTNEQGEVMQHSQSQMESGISNCNAENDKHCPVHSKQTHHQGEDEKEQKRQFVLFVDTKGNTPLHLACRRDPPLRAIRALLALHAPSAWMRTHDGWIPLHLACHCGCDVEVANELLDAMEDHIDGDQGREEAKGGGRGGTDNEVDPLLPRDARGRTPLHLACASSRDPGRRPDLVRLLLLRSRDPKGAVLSRDWVDTDQRMGLDTALGELKVITGGLDADEDESTAEDAESYMAEEASADGRSRRASVCSAAGSPVGRTPLDLIEDDYREELDEALLPGFSVANGIAACRGEGDGDDAAGAPITSTPPDLDYMYECWAVLSVLALSAGTPGTPDRVREALGGARDGAACGRRDGLPGWFSRPCHEVARDFQAINKACRSSDACPARFRELAKKFLQGHVDSRSLGSVRALMGQWETRSTMNGLGRIR